LSDHLFEVIHKHNELVTSQNIVKSVPFFKNESTCSIELPGAEHPSHYIMWETQLQKDESPNIHVEAK
jgi:hypothetical protein